MDIKRAEQLADEILGVPEHDQPNEHESVLAHAVLDLTVMCEEKQWRVKELEAVLRIALACEYEGNWITWDNESANICVGETEDGDPIELQVKMDRGVPVFNAAERAELLNAEAMALRNNAPRAALGEATT